jgi:dienelactone hydrolase
MIRLFIALPFCAFVVRAEPLKDSTLQSYFAAKARQIATDSRLGVDTLDKWEESKPKYRAQLFEMLGLSPLPPKTDLHPTVTGQLERENIIVEKLHFQSLPGLYVTGNLYLPKNSTGPLPTILYVCGHSIVRTNGISYGNKTYYQHHGAWFARNGYACLIIDTIEAGELLGEHHGTYNRGMWWWNSRGYTPAGVEAWNCIRALDYLETRPEVDKTRFGVTGRSGGGAYSWWITALDDRVKVSAPVAGITDLQNHVTDGVVEGHCDCMFFVNTYRWDYPLVAALAAPRPLLICNSDKDTIFPLDGVVRTHAFTKRIYDLYRAPKNLGLLITEGPHQDTQDLQLPVFRWFNRHLKGEDPVISMAATKLFTPAELKVFNQLPTDERTTRIHETFVTPTLVNDAAQLRKTLITETFGGWPAHAEIQTRNEFVQKAREYELHSIDFDSEPNIPLKLISISPNRPEELSLYILTIDDLPALATLLSDEFHLDIPNVQKTEDPNSLDFLRSELKKNSRTKLAFLLVRGDGSADPKKAIQIRRRYMLVGETLDSTRVRDIKEGVDLLRSREKLPLHISAGGRNAANVLMFAALTDRPPATITLINLPKDEAVAPDYLNVSRFTSITDLLRVVSHQHPKLLTLKTE